ncbi:type 1 glutamine amidotransferase [Candidatus Peregrinibacteria bacterium]|nr:type 1 glutamine amidotransferase [Candidatus Peregrinibacteria bacterium]
MKILIIDVLCVPSGERQLDLMLDVLPILKDEKVEIKTLHLESEKLDFDLIEWADKIILSGSFKSVYEEFHWKEDLRKAVDLVIELEKPMHAICFGAQFVAWHLGGKVVRNPAGIEFGVIDLVLTEAGKSHEVLTELVNGDGVTKVHSSHKDAILELPAGATLLAHNSNTPVQAFQYGHILATQFHPDFPTWFMKKLLEMRKNFFIDNGFLKGDLHFENIRSELENGKGGQIVLAKFLDSNKSTDLNQQQR